MVLLGVVVVLLVVAGIYYLLQNKGTLDKTNNYIQQNTTEVDESSSATPEELDQDLKAIDLGDVDADFAEVNSDVDGL